MIIQVVFSWHCSAISGIALSRSEVAWTILPGIRDEQPRAFPLGLKAARALESECHHFWPTASALHSRAPLNCRSLSLPSSRPLCVLCPRLPINFVAQIQTPGTRASTLDTRSLTLHRGLANAPRIRLTGSRRIHHSAVLATPIPRNSGTVPTSPSLRVSVFYPTPPDLIEHYSRMRGLA